MPHRPRPSNPRARTPQPELTPGRDLPTLVSNSLELMKRGATKGQAMALALNAAGYKPPSPG